MIRRFVLSIVLFATAFTHATAADYYMAVDGSDVNAGTVDAPLKTLEKAFAVLNDGDTLILKGGAYSEPIDLDGFTKSVTVKAAPGEDVTLIGARRLEGEWQPWRDGTWKLEINFNIWQLFIGDRLVQLARWPNASFDDGSIWRMTECMRNSDHGWNHKTSEPTGQTQPGLIFDASFESQEETEFREGDREQGDLSNDRPSLAESEQDFTGALAVLNCGHWLTWTRPVTEHVAGADHFTYDPLVDTITHRADQIELRKYVVYYMLGLTALDRPNEWWFDAKTKTVYFKPSKDVEPNTLALRGKIRDHGIVLNNCADLRFEGLRLFSEGFRLNRCRQITFEDCRFDYPATHHFPLNELGITMPGRTGYASALTLSENEDISFLNCEFAYSNAPLYLLGLRTRVENCDFHDIEWDVNSSGACGTIVLGPDALFIRNTVARGGNSEGVRPPNPGSTIRLNRLYDMGNLQHDGAAINVGTRDHIGSLVEKNWAHDSNRQGVRFDYHGENIVRDDGQIHGDGVYLRNVTWNTQSSQVKGDRHLTLNNTVVNNRRYPDPVDELMNMGVMGFQAMHGHDFNENSVTRNNLANLAHRSWNFNPKAQVDAYKLPGVADHNMRERGAPYKYLRDPVNYDFRPRADSPLVDAGAIVEPSEVKSPVARFEQLEYTGDAPDIGAYEYGDPRYWIPGRKQKTASTPVPKNLAVDVPLDCDLMFLEAYRRMRHVVYFGLSPKEMKPIATLNDDTTNIVTPPKLAADTTYYWGVVAFDDNGQGEASPIWNFTTSAN